MALSSSDIKTYRAATNDDTSSNGGRETAYEIVSGTGTLWPSASNTERTAGSTKYRKAFHRNVNASNEVAYNIRVVLDAPTEGEDAIYIFEGTHSDIQSGISSPDLYGAGVMDSGVLAGVSEIDVAVEDGTVTIFRDGDLIRLTDGVTVEWATIDGTPSVAGDVVTLTLADTLANAWDADDEVSSVIEVTDDLEPTIGTPVVTSASGTFDETYWTGDNRGGIYQTWTLTFLSASAFACSGDTKGASGTGNISTTFSPTNPDTSQPYFTITSSAWGGTFTAGDTVAFTTTPSSLPIWEKRVIPAGAASKADNSRSITIYFEGA